MDSLFNVNKRWILVILIALSLVAGIIVWLAVPHGATVSGDDGSMLVVGLVLAFYLFTEKTRKEASPGLRLAIMIGIALALVVGIILFLA